MRTMSRVLVFAALMIFVIMAIGSVNADNCIDLDDHTIEWGEYLVLEVDLTQGSSVVMELEFSSTGPMDVWFIPDYSLVSLITDGDWYHYGSLSSSNVYTYNKFLNLDLGTDDWWYRTYYFVITTHDLNTIDVDVDCLVWVDYDGDGVCGPDDEFPLVNDDWLEALETRLVGIEDNITLDYTYLSGLIDNLITGADAFEENVSDEISDLWMNLEQEVSSLLVGLEDIRVEILSRDGGLEGNISSLQSGLASIQSSLLSLNLSLAELDFETEADLQLLKEGIIASFDNLSKLKDELRLEVKNIDANLSTLRDATYEFELELVNLDDREKENNDARVQESQLTQMDLEKVQEDIENTLAEAQAARTIGIVMGFIGIILAVVAILFVWKTRDK